MPRSPLVSSVAFTTIKPNSLGSSIIAFALALALTACSAGHSSSFQPTSMASSAAASSGAAQNPSGGSHKNAPQAEAVFTGDYVPELPVPAGTVYGYNLDLNTGGITQNSSGGTNGTAEMTVNSAGTLLYVHELGPTMAVFSISPTGSIALVFDTISINSIHSFEGAPVVHPNDRFVYAGAFDQGVVGYLADPTGTMSELPGSPFKPVSQPAGISLSGKFLWGVSASSIMTYAINQNTGVLTFTTPGGGPGLHIQTANGKFTLGDARIDPQGRFLFVTDQSNNAIYTFSVDQNTGAVEQIATTSTGSEVPGVITFMPNDSFLFVGAASGNSDILAYSITNGGGLVPLRTYTLPAPNSGPIRGMKVDLTGHYLYVNTVFYTNGLSIDPSTGKLTPIMNPIFDSNELTDVAVTFLK